MRKFTLFAHSWKNVPQWHRWIDSNNSFLGAKIVNNQPDSFLSYRSSDSLTSSLKRGWIRSIEKRAAWLGVQSWKVLNTQMKSTITPGFILHFLAWHVDNVLGLGGFTWVKEKLAGLYASVMMKSYKLKYVTSSGIKNNNKAYCIMQDVVQKYALRCCFTQNKANLNKLQDSQSS